MRATQHLLDALAGFDTRIDEAHALVSSLYRQRQEVIDRAVAHLMKHKVGDRVGRYEVTKVEGEMVDYRAISTRLGADLGVVLKVRYEGIKVKKDGTLAKERARPLYWLDKDGDEC